MTVRHLSVLLFLGSVVLSGAAVTPAREKRPAGGAVVESAVKGSACDRAGLRPGDVVLSWTGPRLPVCEQYSGTTVRDPFDLQTLEVEAAPMGPVVLEGLRGDVRMRWAVPPGKWDMKVRPRFSEEIARALQAGSDCIQEKDFATGTACFRTAVDSLPETDRASRAWLYLALGERLAQAGSKEDAKAAWAEVLSIAEGEGEGRLSRDLLRAIANLRLQTGDYAGASDAWRRLVSVEQRRCPKGLGQANARAGAGIAAFYQRVYGAAEEALLASLEARRRLASGSFVEAQTVRNLGILYRIVDRIGGSDACYREALGWYEAQMPDSLETAAVWSDLGLVVRRRGELDAAEEIHQRVLSLRRRLAPGSLDEARTWNNLALISEEKGDLDAAVERQRKALALKEALAPGSTDAANSYNNLGIVYWKRSDLAEAERLFRSSLEILERRAPESLDIGNTWNNLGMIAELRGDLSGSEEWYRKSLAVRLKLAAHSLDVAASYTNLGNLFLRRGDLEEAGRDYLAALELIQDLAPGSLQEAICLNNLGLVAKDRGDLDAARSWLAKSLEVRERRAPGSLEVASSIAAIASVAEIQKDFASARDLYGRSLAIREAAAPDGLDVAVTLHGLANVARATGAKEEARTLYLRTLRIRERIAPNAVSTAILLHDLGTQAREADDRVGAIGYLRRAVEVLDAQRLSLGGGKAAAEHFSEEYSVYYRELLDLLLEEGSKEEAFAVLEKGRGRIFLRMLAERDLDFSRDAPAELLGERRRRIAEYEAALDELSKLSGRNAPEESAALNDKLDQARRALNEAQEALRRASPRLASLQDPQPMGSGALQKLLPEGLLFLSYSVGEERSHLFALTRTRLEVYDLPAGRAELAREVRAFRALLGDPSSPMRSVLGSGRSLFGKLLGPARPLMESATLVVVCPEGALHYLPFHALSPDSRTFVAGRWATAAAPSATLLGQALSVPARGWQDARLVALGDPLYPSTADAGRLGPSMRGPLSRGELSPLPSTRKEVESLPGLFGGRSEVYLGAEAREEIVKHIPPGVSYLHLACHGIVDDAHPLESALVLSLPKEGEKAGENGVLQAWEVLEGVRLDASLVVLSACQTGMGKEVRGEGLVGLSRAFQYAGGRSVLASLWSVQDDTTALFMDEFYRGLSRGLSTAQALRDARRALLKPKAKRPGPNTAHPFYWAAFQLVGDVR